MKLSKYVNKNYLKLSKEEIMNLFQDREKNKNKIVRSQLPNILKIASSFNFTRGNDIEEMFSIALESLNNAIDGYIPNKKSSFYSYYTAIITNKLIDYNDNGIRIPKNRVREKIFSTTTPFSHFEDKDFENISDDNYENIKEEEYNPTIPVKIIQEYTKNDKHADIVIKYLGITGDTMTFVEIAKQYNQSYQNINQLYDKSIADIRKNWKR